MKSTTRRRTATRRTNLRRQSSRIQWLEALESRQLMAADMPGVVRNGHDWYLDTNGTPAHEIDLGYGLTGDALYAVGDWSGTGRETPGVARRHASGGIEWLLDLNGDRNPDRRFFFGLNSHKPIAGDFNGDGLTDVAAIGESATPDPVVGLPTLTWHIAYAPFPESTSNHVAVSNTITFGFRGDRPVVGNWDGDLDDDVGIVSQTPVNGLQRWYLHERTGISTADFGFFGDPPVVGDWDGDGDDDLGVVTDDADRNGVRDPLLTWLLATNRDPWADRQLQFGLVTDVPVPGPWAFPEVAVEYQNREIFSSHRIDLGDVAFGDTVELSFVAKNRGTRPITFGLNVQGGGFSIQQAPAASVEAGGSTPFRIAFSASSSGAKSGTIVLATDDGNETQFTVQVTARVLEMPPDPKSLLVAIDVGLISESGGQSSATVTRATSNLSQALLVNLFSSDSTEAVVPTSVTIPAGATSVGFTISAVDDAIVDGTQAVTISASASGFTGSSKRIDITDDDVEVVPRGAIAGTVFNDRNGNRQQNGNEPGLADWTVYLDLNANGHHDADEPARQTDANGSYAFENLPVDTYQVAQVVQSGWQQTFPVCTVAGSTSELLEPMSTTASRDAVEIAVSVLAESNGDDATDIQPGTDNSLDLIQLHSFRRDPRFREIDGRGFTAVILDTGVDRDHAFFGPDRDGNGIADRIVFSYDFADNDANAGDTNGHGTHVTGTVGSQDSQYPGVAPGANLIHLKVFSDTGGGEFRYVESALQWVSANASRFNIASVNMSLGDSGNYSQALSQYGIGDELALLASQNVIVVSAAGNSFFGHGSRQGVGYPAADPNSLAVGAVWDGDNGGPYFWGSGAIDGTTAADRLVSFSQRHQELTEVFAPGAMITSAYLDGRVADLAGTSMASPHVAGAAVLAQQLATQHLGRRLTLAEFRSVLSESSDTIHDGDDEDDNVGNTGVDFGRLNMLQLGEAILRMRGCSHTVTVSANETAEAHFGDIAFLNSLAAIAAGGELASEVESLSPEELDAIAVAAIDRWTQAGASPLALAMLDAVSLRVTDLPGNLISQATGTEIAIDFNAAERGWFVDATPRADDEFVTTEGKLQVATTGPAAARIDLLSAVFREFAAFAGESDSSSNTDESIVETMMPGSRLVPAAQQPPAPSMDINGDGNITPLDALILINAINSSSGSIASMDLSGDNWLSAIDVLQVVHFLNDRSDIPSVPGSAEGEGTSIVNRGRDDSDIHVSDSRYQLSVKPRGHLTVAVSLEDELHGDFLLPVLTQNEFDELLRDIIC